MESAWPNGWNRALGICRRISATKWHRRYGSSATVSIRFTGHCRCLCLTLVSVGMWYVIALAYQEVTHSYGVAALEIPVSQLLILMGASMVGSMLQLPAVGGGSQMATISDTVERVRCPPRNGGELRDSAVAGDFRRSGAAGPWPWPIARDCRCGSCRRKAITPNKRR